MRRTLAELKAALDLAKDATGMTLAKASMAMFSEGRTSLCAFGRWGLAAMVGTGGGVQGVRKDPNSKKDERPPCR